MDPIGCVVPIRIWTNPTIGFGGSPGLQLGVFISDPASNAGYSWNMAVNQPAMGLLLTKHELK
jgi:hypothetical protein